MHVEDYQSTTAPPTVRPVPPPTREPGSRLGGLVVSLAVIAIGVVGVIDLGGLAVSASVYAAAPLAVVGLGLVVGAWFGRARWLIPIGAVLLVTLGIMAAAEAFSGISGSTTWRPTTMEELENSYSIDIGNAVLDLSGLDFAGRSENVDVRVDVGDLTVTVPSEVDVRARVAVDVGSANVFGVEWNGIGHSTRTINDLGADGPGGGELFIQVTVDIGDVEVHR